LLIVTWVKKLLSDWNDPIFIYLQNIRLKTLLWLTIWLNALCHCDQLPWVQLANTTVVVWHSTCKFSESVILPILVTWKESCYLLWELSSRIQMVTCWDNIHFIFLSKIWCTRSLLHCIILVLSDMNTFIFYCDIMDLSWSKMTFYPAIGIFFVIINGLK
jgi:hypothetical protein